MISTDGMVGLCSHDHISGTRRIGRIRNFKEGCAPFVIYQQYNNPKQIQWQPNQPVPGYLVFQVYDVGDLLDSSAVYSANTSGQNEDWSMTLLVSEN